MSSRGEGRLHRRGGPPPAAPRHSSCGNEVYPPSHSSSRGCTAGRSATLAAWTAAPGTRVASAGGWRPQTYSPGPHPSPGAPPCSLLRPLHFPASSYTCVHTAAPARCARPPTRDVTRGLSFSGLFHLACTMPLRSTQVVTSGRVPFFLGAEYYAT